MNSKAIGADVTIAWPSAEIGSMDANLAAKIMYEGQGAEVIKEKATCLKRSKCTVDSLTFTHKRSITIILCIR